MRLPVNGIVSFIIGTSFLAVVVIARMPTPATVETNIVASPNTLDITRGGTNESCPDKLPDGYALERDQFGNYRPIRSADGMPLFWLKEHGTKCEAIKRAVDQDTHYRLNAQHKWAREDAP